MQNLQGLGADTPSKHFFIILSYQLIRLYLIIPIYRIIDRISPDWLCLLIVFTCFGPNKRDNTVYNPPSLSRATRRFTRRLILALKLTGKHTHTQSCNPRRRYHPFRPHRQVRHLHPTAILHLWQHELVRLRSGITPYGCSLHSAHEPPLHRR